MIREFNEEHGSHSHRPFLLRKEKNPQTGSTISVGGTARETNRCANSCKGRRGRKGKKNKQGLINDESKVIKLATTGLGFTSWKKLFKQGFFPFVPFGRTKRLVICKCLRFIFSFLRYMQANKEAKNQASKRLLENFTS